MTRNNENILFLRESILLEYTIPYAKRSINIPLKAVCEFDSFLIMRSINLQVLLNSIPYLSLLILLKFSREYSKRPQLSLNIIEPAGLLKVSTF